MLRSRWRCQHRLVELTPAKTRFDFLAAVPMKLTKPPKIETRWVHPLVFLLSPSSSQSSHGSSKSAGPLAVLASH